MTRLLAIADGYDWQKLGFGYQDHEAMQIDEAIAHFKEYRGKRYNPELTNQFIEYLKKEQGLSC